jgi:hypothetical protein
MQALLMSAKRKKEKLAGCGRSNKCTQHRHMPLPPCKRTVPAPIIRCQLHDLQLLLQVANGGVLVIYCSLAAGQVVIDAAAKQHVVSAAL